MRTYEEALKQYKEECEGIAIQCEEEGYPAHGSNYELRVEALEEQYPELFGKEEEGPVEYGWVKDEDTGELVYSVI